MLLPELPESAATGEIATIYAEIKHFGGVPMVALIFRHLATLPGALEWTWSAIGPAWRSGRLQEAAWRIAREAPLPELPSISRSALHALDVDEAALAEIHTTLAAYNTANPENMLSVLCVLRLLDGNRATSPLDPRAWTPPAAPGPLVPMGDVTNAPANVMALLDLVAAPGASGSPRVVQSLYRHFMHRPAFLALAVTLLRQRFEDGCIDRSVAAIDAEMTKAADQIARQLSAPPAPHPGIAIVCERFGGGVIPQMITVGAMLECALP